MENNKDKDIQRIVKWIFPVMLFLVFVGLYWVGSNTLVIGTTISTVDKELKGAYLERDAYNSKMKEEGRSRDSIQVAFDQLKQQSDIARSIEKKKIDSLMEKAKNEKNRLETVVSNFRSYRDSVKQVQYKRSAVEDRYKDDQ